MFLHRKAMRRLPGAGAKAAAAKATTECECEDGWLAGKSTLLPAHYYMAVSILFPCQLCAPRFSYMFLYISLFSYIFPTFFYIFLHVLIKKLSDSPGRAASIFITTNKIETAICFGMLLSIMIETT